MNFISLKTQIFIQNTVWGNFWNVQMDKPEFSSTLRLLQQYYRLFLRDVYVHITKNSNSFAKFYIAVRHGASRGPKNGLLTVQNFHHLRIVSFLSMAYRTILRQIPSFLLHFYWEILLQGNLIMKRTDPLQLVIFRR